MKKKLATNKSTGISYLSKHNVQSQSVRLTPLVIQAPNFKDQLLMT